MHDCSLTELKKDSPTLLLRISRSDESQSPTSSLSEGVLLNPQLLEPLHRMDTIPKTNIQNLHDGNSSSSPSRKRKRLNNFNVSATEKVQQWQAYQDQVDVEGSEQSVPEEQSPNKRIRSMAPPPASPKTLEYRQSAPGTSINKDFVRLSQKKVRVILRQLKDFPNARIRMKHQLMETEEILEVAETVHRKNEGMLTEMQWTRYIIEEDVLRRQKADRTLVDGTEKLGSASTQARDWRKWLQQNTMTRHSNLNRTWSDKNGNASARLDR
ncbi:hypothetical protein F5050DRAFT_1355934 [Lentinula boryana]|uniref:Uncharacterized protein n=1 Tax=Lentinula boryana TaxID=40481 RepID=A0ABQ8QH59_9AGAR|nr:hypothetical protein F5050DRAFT_1355934 [Lentinula boryana]